MNTLTRLGIRAAAVTSAVALAAVVSATPASASTTHVSSDLSCGTMVVEVSMTGYGLTTIKIGSQTKQQELADDGDGMTLRSTLHSANWSISTLGHIDTWSAFCATAPQ